MINTHDILETINMIQDENLDIRTITMGISLLDCMSEDYKIAAQKVYDKGLNIDYFPTNFVVQDGEVYYIDYECNNYMDEWNFENWGVKYWSKTKEFMEYIEKH